MKTRNRRKILTAVVAVTVIAGMSIFCSAAETLTEKAGEETEAGTAVLNEAEAGTAVLNETEAGTEVLKETEAVSESSAEKGEDPDPQNPEEGGGDQGDGGQGDQETPQILSGVTMEDDKDGAYYAFSIPDNAVSADLTVSIVDGGGAQVGSSPVYLGTVTGSAYRKSYILSLSEGNVFGLSDNDIGKTVRIRVTAETEDGKTQTLTSDTSVTLRYPSMTMPSVVSYTAAAVVSDLLDGSKIGGLSFDSGSFGVRRIVEKQSGSDWIALDGSAAVTAENEGNYRIRIQTLFGDLFSNEFKVVVPATGITVTGDQRIGSTLTAAAQGPGGYAPKQVSYTWTFAGAEAPVCTDAVYTPTLKDAVAANAMALTVSVTDVIGNVFSQIVTLAPMDLSTQELTADGYTELIYDGDSQIPYDAKIMLGDYVIPPSLYTLAAAPGKNTVKAGKAWMSVTGNSAYLTGTALVRYRIMKDEEDTEEETPAVASPEPETQPAPAPVPAPAPAPKETKPVDLTVTDVQGNASPYQTKVVTPLPEEEKEAVQVYLISADPVKKADGNVLTDDYGKPVYHQRNLHITPALMKTVQERSGRMIRFMLGDAAIQLDMSVLDSGTAYTVKLAVLEDEDLTENEKTAISGYGEGIRTYAMRIVRDTDNTDVTDIVADTGKLEVLLRTVSGEKASILFLKEKREQTQVKPVPYVADGQLVSNEGLTYVKRTAPGSGIFGLLKNQ